MESQLIARFNSPWPRQSYVVQQDASKQYNKGTAAIKKLVILIVVIVLTNLLHIPPSLQDLVMDIFSVLITGYLVLLHMQLWKIYPILALGPFLVVLTVFHFVTESGKADAKMKQQKLKSKETKYRPSAVHSQSSFASRDATAVSFDSFGLDATPPVDSAQSTHRDSKSLLAVAQKAVARFKAADSDSEGEFDDLQLASLTSTPRLSKRKGVSPRSTASTTNSKLLRKPGGVSPRSNNNRYHATGDREQETPMDAEQERKHFYSNSYSVKR